MQNGEYPLKCSAAVVVKLKLAIHRFLNWTG
jgi:hypothetical protein